MIFITPVYLVFMMIFYQVNSLKYKVIHLFEFVKKNQIEYELNNLQELYQQLSHKPYNFIQNYVFDIRALNHKQEELF